MGKYFVNVTTRRAGKSTRIYTVGRVLHQDGCKYLDASRMGSVEARREMTEPIEYCRHCSVRPKKGPYGRHNK